MCLSHQTDVIMSAGCIIFWKLETENLLSFVFQVLDHHILWLVPPSFIFKAKNSWLNPLILHFLMLLLSSFLLLSTLKNSYD